MPFQENLAALPDIGHLDGINICDAAGSIVRTIPAVEGKLGSLKVYNALAAEFDGVLNRHSAKQGLAWFDEIVSDAQKNPGKHPNIDLLLKVQDEDLIYTLKPLAK